MNPLVIFGLVPMLAAPAPDAAPSPQVVINEISAAGAEWVEIHNAGDEPADLSRWMLVDAAPDGRARTAGARRFPRGAVISGHGYLLVLAKQGKKTRDGRQSQCLGAGTPDCYHVRWGISRERGETVRLLDGDGRLRSEVQLPPHAVTKGQTWSRRSDATFAASSPSAGAANP